MSPVIRKIDRRTFVQTGAAAAGGLVLGFGSGGAAVHAQAAASPARLNGFIHIGADDAVTLSIHKSEMGQGTVTSLAMLLAEELDCDWSKVRTEFPGVDSAAYGNNQSVFGSSSIRTMHEALRQAGAAAREMLLNAAARRWGVAPSQCRTENGGVVNTQTTARFSYGSLAEAASQIPVPANPALKAPSAWRLLGRPTKRLDTPSKVNGTARFGLDVRVPGMVYAVVARSPVLGGRVATFDATKAKAVPGVKDVVQVPSGIAVVAENTWAAMQGRRALEVKWDEGANATLSSAIIRQQFNELVQQPSAAVIRKGDVDGALAAAATKLEAFYEAPYQAHAPMEPLNCTVDLRAERCDIWVGTQAQTTTQRTVARLTGLQPQQIRVQTTYLGGGFGRRFGTDFVAEAVEIAKIAKTPVKLTWTREDDTRHGAFRPASVTRLAGALDAGGRLIALHARMVHQSFFGANSTDVDRLAVEGMATLPYDVPNTVIEHHAPRLPVPVTFWRSVAFSQNTFFLESFVDELAAAVTVDPVAFRRTLLASEPRLLRVLNELADRSGWGTPLPAGRFRGIALVNNLESFNGQVAEVSVSGENLRVHRIVSVVDCGTVVNPAGVIQQMESGIVFGLTAALKGAITLDRGGIVQGNFTDYQMLRIDEMPRVEVHIVRSDEKPGGIGEASTPCVAPAIANAVYAATGKRIRALPITPQMLA